MVAQTKSRFKNKRVAVLGFGVESQETVEFLLKHGASAHVLDEKEESAFDASRLQFLRNEGVAFTFGNFSSLDDFDLIIRSPGVRPGIRVLHHAADKGIPVTSATNIFFENAKGVTIGITGTKGKGTTAACLYQTLKTAGREVYLGGNIGVPALSFLDKLSDNSVSILELSSFQLMDLQHSPHIAIVLMVTQDHLDYHTSRDEYVFAKSGIAKFQSPSDYVIANVDYPASLKIAEFSPGIKLFFSNRNKVPEGCFIENDSVIVKTRKKKEKIVSTAEVLLPGRHNHENICAAVMAAQLLNVPNGVIRDVLKTFPGLEHRLELVREVGGVKYYNDSISTTPDSTVAAIRAFEQPKILILGGSSKGSDFTELGNVISQAKNIKAVIGMGAEWPKIKQRIMNKELGIRLVEGLATMEKIVQTAARLSKPGDVVILSPACASFDMFKDYKDRGNQFRAAVNRL